MAYLALYRKYRSARFDEIYGQPAIVRALKHQIESGRIAHAYLFSGPRGTGKTSVAKIFAKAINCANPVEGEPCGVCPSCLDFQGTPLDIMEIDAASNNSVDKVREMQENINYLPAVGQRRVYIIDEVHMLSASAFNALLKTLEEPPAHVVFLLATTEPHKLPVTVLSRCQRFDFKRIPLEDIVARLQYIVEQENVPCETGALETIARASDGGLRDAISLLDQCIALAEGAALTRALVEEVLGSSGMEFYLDMCRAILEGRETGALELLDAFVEGGGDLRVSVQDICRVLRDIYAGAGEDVRILALSRAHPRGAALHALEAMADIEAKLRYSTNQRVLVELALFKSTRHAQTEGVEGLLLRLEKLELALKNGAAPPMTTDVPTPITASASAPVASTPPAEKKVPEESEPPKQEIPPWEEAPPVVSEAAESAPPDDAPPFVPPEAPPFDPDMDEAEAILPAVVSEEEDEPFLELLAEDEPAVEVPARQEPAAIPTPQPSTAQADTEEEPPTAQPAIPDAPGDMPDPEALWKAVSEAAAPNLRTELRLGKGMAFEGNSLLVVFPIGSETTLASLQAPRRKENILNLMEQFAGKKMQLRLEMASYNAQEQAMLQQSMLVLPPDKTNIIS